VKQSLSLGERIRKHREAAGLSLRTLASKAGVDVANVSRLESGDATQPKPETVTRLAEALGIDASELLTAAGYTTNAADALPTLPIYLRSKYGHLPASARQELAEYVGRLEAEFGSKPKANPRKTIKKNT
jgi:transcriptional regulator with XRE-family HTH domain